MDYLKQNHLAILIIAFLVGSFFFGGGSPLGVAANVTTITNPWVFNKSITQATTNTATTTFSGGCIQTTATSTATPIRFVIGSTVQGTSTYQGGVSQGEVAWQYGSCPI